MMWAIKNKTEKSGYVFMILILIRHESVPYHPLSNSIFLPS